MLDVKDKISVEAVLLGCVPTNLQIAGDSGDEIV